MMVIQEVQRFPNHIDTSAIAESMNGRIDKGWRVHSCLVRGAEVIIVYERNEEARDSINCLEKACDELKEALKKKDYELKAVRHYYNECLKDLKKAHAEIERLQTENNQFADIGKMYSEIKAEAIKEFAERLKTNVFEVDDINEDIFLAVEVSYIDYLVKEMVGDTEC